MDVLLGFKRKYLMLFLRIVSSHIMCAQKIHFKVVLEVFFFSNSSEFYKALDS